LGEQGNYTFRDIIIWNMFFGGLKWYVCPRHTQKELKPRYCIFGMVTRQYHVHVLMKYGWGEKNCPKSEKFHWFLCSPAVEPDSAWMDVLAF
jgi:hypothetical protein